MRISTVISALSAFCLVTAQSKTGGSNTIFQILNTTNASSPALYQFAYFLNSSPDYQPIIDILNDPNSNVTLFVPEDGLLYNLTGQKIPALPSTTTTSRRVVATKTSSLKPIRTTTLPSSFGYSDLLSAIYSSPTPNNQANYIRLPNVDEDDSTRYFEAGAPTIKQSLSGLLVNNNGTVTIDSSANITNITTSPFASNFSVLDILYYHIVNGTQSFQENTTAILSSLLTNSTINKFGYSSPVLVQPNLNLTEFWMNEGNSSMVGNMTNGTMIESNNNTWANLTVGNGLGYDASINGTYNASNGAIYIIDKVLIPPVNVTSTLSAVQNASDFDALVNGTSTYNNSTTTTIPGSPDNGPESTFSPEDPNSPESTSPTDPNSSGDSGIDSIFQELLRKLLSNFNETLNDATNITLFVPNNDAFQNVDVSTLDEQTISDLIQAHTFKGVYYTTNVTYDTPVTAESESGANVTLENSPDNGFTVNGTTVVQPNILLNNGVMHLIDGILSYPTGDQQRPTGVGGVPTATGDPYPTDSTEPYTTQDDDGMGMYPTQSDYGPGMYPTQSDDGPGMYPTDQQPTDQLSADQQPTDQQPADQQPTDQQPTPVESAASSESVDVSSANMPTLASTLTVLSATFFFYFLYV
ncbi:hypothetical protein BD770DRAFT_409482 [Pilaira anomala]|nr:hypothetical protein BD770DRAFT_409482 [Pilaira anomala]